LLRSLSLPHSGALARLQFLTSTYLCKFNALLTFLTTSLLSPLSSLLPEFYHYVRLFMGKVSNFTDRFRSKEKGEAMRIGEGEWGRAQLKGREECGRGGGEDGARL